MALCMAMALGILPAQSEAKAKNRPAKVAVKGKQAAKAKARPARVAAKKARPVARARLKGKAQARMAARAVPRPAPLKLVDGKPVLQASVAYVVDQDSGEVLYLRSTECSCAASASSAWSRALVWLPLESPLAST